MGSSLRVCGTYVDSCRSWGIYMNSASGISNLSDLSNKVLVVPSGLGAHLMGKRVAQQFGLELGENFRLLVVESFAAAVISINTGLAFAALWEKYSSAELVRSGQWRLIRDMEMPWPSVLFVATKDALEAKSMTIKKFMNLTRTVCQEFTLNKESQSERYIATVGGLSREDALSWMRQTSWTCSCSVDLSAIVGPMEYIQLFETNCTIPQDPSRFLGDTVNIVGNVSQTAHGENSMTQSGSKQIQDHTALQLRVASRRVPEESSMSERSTWTPQMDLKKLTRSNIF